MGPRLMGDLLRGRARVMEPLLDLLSAPIATEACLLLIAVCLPVRGSGCMRWEGFSCSLCM